jgi:hypothetical protein
MEMEMSRMQSQVLAVEWRVNLDRWQSNGEFNGFGSIRSVGRVNSDCWQSNADGGGVKWRVKWIQIGSLSMKKQQPEGFLINGKDRNCACFEKADQLVFLVFLVFLVRWASVSTGPMVEILPTSSVLAYDRKVMT